LQSTRYPEADSLSPQNPNLSVAVQAHSPPYSTGQRAKQEPCVSNLAEGLWAKAWDQLEQKGGESGKKTCSGIPNPQRVGYTRPRRHRQDQEDMKPCPESRILEVCIVA
jgi:hypothetical protein